MKLYIYIIIYLVIFIFTGCNTQPQPQSENDLFLELKNNKANKTHSSKKKIIQKKNPSKTLQDKKIIYEKVPVFDKGYNKRVSLRGKYKKNFILKNGQVKLSVEEIPLNEFIDLVFGSVLKVNYTLSKDVRKMKDPITLNMSEPQKASQFANVVKKILALHGVGIKNEDGVLFLYKEGEKNRIATKNISIGYGKYLPQNIDEQKEVAQFVPFDYIEPDKVVGLARKIGITSQMVKFYKYFGMQLLIGKAYNVKKALEVIKLLDQPYLSGKTPYLIHFENIEVKNFTEKMKKIYQLNNINVVDTPSKGGIVLLPIEELNSLYIITPKKEWLKMLLYWKNKLDIEAQTQEEPELYIYHVKNRKADELAKAIQVALGLASAIKQTNLKKEQNVAGEKQQKKTSVTKLERATNSFLISRVNYTPTVTADLDTNILMMKLTPKHYRTLLPFIKKLDKLPLQTLVEVTVAEVDMTDTFSLGFEYAIRNKGLGVDNILNITGGGSGIGIVFTGNKIDATINAFAEKKLLDIVSKPKVLILNNTRGNINVGTQVPIIMSETSAPDITTGQTPTINRNINYRTTGINLGLTPTINSNGVLTMDISISLSEAQTNDTSGIDSPLIVTRDLKTKAVINSGDTILIGGLISHNKSATKGGVPFLKDIPLIGALFATQSHKTTKTELIMLIRPIIIENKDTLNSETEKFKTILEYLKTEDL